MSTYAIIETGSKQYRVEQDTIFDVEKLKTDEKTKQITLDRVLLVKNDKSVKIGTPVVKGAKVVCNVLGTGRGKKVISFKFRRRKDSQKIRGHRQTYTRLQVKDIVAV